MTPKGLFGRIVASLQEAALDPGHWPTAAGLIDMAIGAKGSSVLITGDAGLVPESIAWWRICLGGQRHEDLEREYFRAYWPHDERVPRMGWLPSGELMPVPDLYTEDEKKTSLTYNEFLPRADMQKGLHVRLDGPDRSHIIWTFGDSIEARGWSTAQIAAIERLLPHLSLFGSMWLALADTRALGRSFAGLLEGGSTGLVQLDRQGRIVESNDAATKLLRHRNGVLDSGGYLRALAPRENDRLRRLVARAVPPFGEQGSAGTMTIRRSRSRTRLMLHVSPVAGREWEFRPVRVAAVVLVVDPERRSRIDPELAAEVLGLTPAESRLAVMLADGHSLREIASRTDRTEGTVRWHLKQIFRKQGISRQTDLVRRVLSLERVAGRP